MNRAAGLVAIVGSAASVLASPQESVTFNPAPSNGVLNSASNTVLNHSFNGGYTLGRIQVTGTLSAVHANTWRTDSRIRITAPDGLTTFTFQPFTSGTTFTSLPFSASFFLPAGTNPAGSWTFRFFEAVDDGGAAIIDANWNVTVTLTNDQPTPPAATSLGVLAAPGLALPGQSLAVAQVRWWTFTVPASISATAMNHLDLDTFGSLLPATGGSPANDTAIGLYDATGQLVASDDDSCDGFTSQLSFGFGGRPPRGDGRPLDGQNGPLPAGLYYLAIGAFPMQFGPSRWEATSTGTVSGTLTLNAGFSPLSYCYPNCDGSTGSPRLTANDFACFLNAFVGGQAYANCDGSTVNPTLTANDFVCFVIGYSGGCS